MTITTRPRETTVETTLVSLVTADEFSRLPETNRICELIDGEVVMAPAPLTKHQWVLGRLYRLVDDFVEQTGSGIAFFSPFDVELSTYQVYQPDIVVVSRDRAAHITRNGFRGAPDLVMEVLSPSNRKQDLVVKAAEYASAGVPEYWVVDPVDDRIEVNRLTEGAYSAVPSADGVARSVVLPGLAVAPAAVFTMPAWMVRPSASAEQGED